MFSGPDLRAGIGFTVALFITELALSRGVDQANAKLAILLTSVVSALLSIILLMGPSVKSSDADEA